MSGISHFTPAELAELAAFDAQIDALDFVSPEDVDSYLPRRRGPKPNPNAQQCKKEKEKAYRAAHRDYYNQKCREWYQRNREKARAKEAERKKKKKAASRRQSENSPRQNISPTV